jgi:hypothetical protein
MPRSGGVLATFTSVSEPDRSFTSHSAYINAVHDCLQERDIRVSATMEVTSRGPRNAQLRLRPPRTRSPTPFRGKRSCTGTRKTAGRWDYAATRRRSPS